MSDSVYAQGAEVQQLLKDMGLEGKLVHSIELKATGRLVAVCVAVYRADGSLHYTQRTLPIPEGMDFQQVMLGSGLHDFSMSIRAGESCMATMKAKVTPEVFKTLSKLIKDTYANDPNLG